MILIISPKEIYASKRLKHEARIMNYDVQILDVEDLVKIGFKMKVSSFSALYIRSPYLKGSPKYIPEIIKLAKKFKKAGKTVVDANIANEDLGKGKWEDYKRLARAKIQIPKTELIPEIARSAFASQSRDEASFIKQEKKIINETATSRPLADETLGKGRDSRFPYVLKWIFGMKAKGTFLINSQISNFPSSRADESAHYRAGKFQNIVKQHPKKEWMLQEYIEADFEYKVVTVGYKALPVVLRFDFNKKLGRVEFGSATPIVWRHSEPRLELRYDGAKNLNLGRDPSADQVIHRRPQDDAERAVRLAEKASKTLGRELAKVDILQKGDKFYVLEVNRFPGLKSFEELSKFNVFKEFIQYLHK